MKKLALFTLIALLPSCITTSLSLPVAAPKEGGAVIKGGTLYMVPFIAQYTYIAGVDGTLFEAWTGSKQIPHGKHRFAFAASHAAGIKSVAETTLDIKDGGRYLVEITDINSPGAVYAIYEMPGRKLVKKISVPLVHASDYRSRNVIESMLMEKGWKKP